MKTLKFIFLLFGFSITLLSCRKEPKLSPISVVDDSLGEGNTALDKMIRDSLTTPYNISVIYRYVDALSDFNYQVVPTDYESSRRMVRFLLEVGIKPYDIVTGSKEFISTTFPKNIHLFGSSKVGGQSVVMATAEGGVQIDFYGINNLNARNSKDPVYLNDFYFKTMHHEFQHILNQKKVIPPSFFEITPTAYVSDRWSQVYQLSFTAINDGFITPYASKNPDEDFAELYATYVTNTKEDFENIFKNRSVEEEGTALVLEKMETLKKYMLTQWNIDMDELRAVYINSLNNLPDID